ncbi:right-handed parallel beta-helix repeat-containing protein [Sphingobacterium thalpophilum]|uniref:right-handed parallel beta-helix repeat-containing protein n=1 Tax=Sphingobacterium thalpophilum TaxID=259 RepID=UPI003C71015A
MANQFLVKETMAAMRGLSATEITALQNGSYDGVQLLGYYEKGDTPAPIIYYLSDSVESDNGGSVVSVDGIKLAHEFVGSIFPGYFGANSIDDSSDIFQNITNLYPSPNIDLNGRTFNINTRYNTKNNTSIRNGNIVLGSTNKYDTIWLTGENIKVEDLNILCGAQEKLGALRLHLCKNVRLQNVQILGNNPGIAIFCNSLASNVYINKYYAPLFRCGFQYNDAVGEQGSDFRKVDGINYAGQVIGEGVFLTDSTISTTDKTWGGDGFLINTPDNGFKTVRITNLIIQRTIRPTPDFAGGFGIAFANCNDVIVKGCTISNSGHTAIHAEKGYNYTIESNNIYTSVKGLNIEQLRLAKVLNNNVFGCVDGFSTYNANVNSIDWDVSGNYFDGCTGYPAIVSSSDRGKFNNNIFINSNTTSAILSIQTTNGRPCSNSEFKNNKFILGTGSGTVALFLSTESTGNIFEDTQYTGYISTSFLQNTTTNRARVESYIGEGNKKGAMIWSDKDPNGYYNGRAGDLCTDTVLGIFWVCKMNCVKG